MTFEELNRFVFYGDWVDNIKDLPIEMQDKIIAEIVRYGINAPRQYEDDMMVSMAVNFTKGAINSAKWDYFCKIQGGKTSGRKKSVDSKKIYEMARSGKKTAEDVANELGVSKSTIEHDEGWKNRKNDKWLDGKNEEFKF